MADLNSTLTTLNANGLNISVKTQRLPDCILKSETKPYTTYTKSTRNVKTRIRFKKRENLKKAGVAKSIDKVGSRTKNVTVKIKGSFWNQ